MKKLFFWGLCITLLAMTSLAIAVDERSFYQQACNNVLRLENGFYSSSTPESTSISSINYKSNAPIGTAFIVHLGRKAFVVTARHVAEQNFDLHARVMVYNKETKKNEIFILNLPKDNWTFHPNGGDKETWPVDVAAMKIGAFSDASPYSLVAFNYDPSDFTKSQLKNIDPSPPEQIIILGFPGDVGFQLTEQRPMARNGIIAMTTGEKFLKVTNPCNDPDGCVLKSKFAEEKTFLVDSRIFGGNSGGPIIDTASNLVGIITASNSEMLYAIAEPASRIRETIDVANEKPFKQFDYWLKTTK